MPVPAVNVGRPIKRVEDAQPITGREDAVYDDQGHLLSSTLMVYAMPKADDLIAFDNGHTHTNSPRTALGVKGIGKSATIGSTPAIANAVLDALSPLGVTHLDIPLTAPKVRAAIQRAPKK
jgi:carbon-monoxide dehydrogenase large subunit